MNKIWFYNTVVWRLKQLLPFEYETQYSENGRDYSVTWRMWLRRFFNVPGGLAGAEGR